MINSKELADEAKNTILEVLEKTLDAIETAAVAIRDDALDIRDDAAPRDMLDNEVCQADDCINAAINVYISGVGYVCAAHAKEISEEQRLNQHEDIMLAEELESLVEVMEPIVNTIHKIHRKIKHGI